MENHHVYSIIGGTWKKTGPSIANGKLPEDN
jgi:hypothetical protein